MEKVGRLGNTGAWQTAISSIFWNNESFLAERCLTALIIVIRSVKRPLARRSGYYSSGRDTDLSLADEVNQDANPISELDTTSWPGWLRVTEEIEDGKRKRSSDDDGNVGIDDDVSKLNFNSRIMD